MIGLKFVCLYLYFVIGVWAERKLPSYVQICKRFDPELSKCWQNSLLALRPYLAKGIPEFDIPPIGSYRLDGAHLDRSKARSMNLIADFSNITFYGMENYELPSAKVDYKSYTVEMTIVFPTLKIIAKYKAKGKILAFDFEGDGDAELEFVKVATHVKWYMSLHTKNGKEHLKLDKSDLHAEVEKLSVYFHDLFKDNPEITKTVNMAINDNIDILFEEVKPLAEEIMLSLFNRHAQRVIDLYSTDVLFPKE